MGTKALVAGYLLAMVAVVVGVDVAFLRHHIWLRLGANVAIVVVFVAVYLWVGHFRGR